MKKNLKKWISAVGIIALCAVGFASATQMSNINNKDRDDSRVESDVLGLEVTKITENEYDTSVIPDKYNTGCSGSLSKITGSGYTVIDGVEYRIGDNVKIDFKYTHYDWSNIYNVTVSNKDFSGGTFRIYNPSALGHNITLVFENCKFATFYGAEADNISYVFKNCSFYHINATGNANFYNCYFGGGNDGEAQEGDGINPGSNSYFENCYISNLMRTATTASGQHIDGFQVFKEITNVSLNNCRFEVPYIPLSVSSGALNCPITFTLTKGNASNITIQNCYVNGGRYYSIALGANSGYGFSNVNINNIKVGESSKSSTLSEFASLPGVNVGNKDGINFNNVTRNDSLYVSSVWKSDEGIHLSVTNDTNVERTIKVITDKGENTFTIAACPKSINIANNSMTFEDFPFDLEKVVEGSEWLVCFDITDGINKQIRYINWSDKIVSLDKELKVVQNIETVSGNTTATAKKLSLNSTITNNVIEKGSCGNQAKYILYEDGELVVYGTGATKNYSAAGAKPWSEHIDEIKKVTVKSGITVLGASLFSGCTNLTTVNIENGVTEFGSNLFKNDKALKEIFIPKSVTIIGKYSFAGVTLTSCKYEGSPQEFDNIKVGANGNDGLYKTKTICNSTMTSNSVSTIAATSRAQLLSSISQAASSSTSAAISSVASSSSAAKTSNTAKLSDAAKTSSTAGSSSSAVAKATNTESNSSADVVEAGNNKVSTSSNETGNSTNNETSNEAVELSGKCGKKIEWTLKNGVLELTGTGETFGFHSGNLPAWYAYRSQIKEIIVGEGITYLGSQIFVDLTEAEKITLPSTLTSVGKYAYKHCYKLNIN